MTLEAQHRPAGGVDDDLLARFTAMSDVMSISCVVADAQERANVMHSSMRLRVGVTSFIGPALTVHLSPGDLVDPLAVLEAIRPGDVVVVDAFGETETSVWGGLMSSLARAAGAVGAVIDGAARDIDEARMVRFPIVSRSVTPRSTHSPYSSRYAPLVIGAPIVCGGVQVAPGDVIVADEIGVTVVPRADLAVVYERAADQAAREEQTRVDIASGMSYRELLEKHGRI